jgi:3-oxoacyl-[acyl-carrier-protein] synthase II
MKAPVRVAGLGVVRVPGGGVGESLGLAARLSTALATLTQTGPPIRLVQPIEEVAVVAAHEALASAGIPMPVRGEEIGIALGVEEGIDGPKAEYYRRILKDGPLGSSPLLFPFTTPNTVAARLSILLDLRGENFTLCGGSLSGAQAIGLAMNAVREARPQAMLTGGVTAVGREFLDALACAGRPDDGEVSSGACVFLLERSTSAGGRGATAELLGYAEGFGQEDVRDAVLACLEDAGISAEQVQTARVASAGDARPLLEALHRLVPGASVVRSAAPHLYAASFPLAVAESVQAANAIPGPALVVGTDCLSGASAALVRGRAPR